MAKIDVEKLRALLAEQGMEEEQIEAIIAQASEETPNVPEGEGGEPSTSSEVPPEEEIPSDVPPVPEGEAEGVPPQDEVPPEAASVPPVPEELPPEVPPAEPPVEELPPEPVPTEPEPVLPPEPQGVSLEEFMQLKTDFEELKKAFDGLSAQNASLKEALQAAGVIDGSTDSEVGLDQPSAPGTREVDTTMDDVLREINRKGY